MWSRETDCGRRVSTSHRLSLEAANVGGPMTSNDVMPIHPMRPVHATVRPPGSKSITNRALICAALAEGRSSLEGALDSEDTRVMYQALAALGIALCMEPRPWPDRRGGKWWPVAVSTGRSVRGQQRHHHAVSGCDAGDRRGTLPARRCAAHACASDW